jgi:hypothetical protein
VARHETATKILSKKKCWLLSLTLSFLLVSCAQYSSRISKPRSQLDSGLYSEAIEELKKLVANNDNDKLLYLMDLGLVYHTAGLYKEAIQTFSEADKLAELEDFTSVSAEVGSVILNDDVKAYKGEDFEKIMIHLYLAMDYTLLKNFEAALVECRRINRAIDKMIREGKLPYEQNAFAKYLAASLFESQKEYNDAFVDYRQLVKWNVQFPYLPPPLLKMAKLLGAEQEFADYKKKLSVGDFKMPRGEGEVILFVETGKSPVKVPSPNFRLVPIFERRGYVVDSIELKSKNKSAKSYTLFDIEETAVKELDAKMAGIVAKKMAGVAAKEALAYGVAKTTKSEGWGLLTSLFLHVSDHADTRSWSTLPAKLQLVRMSLPPGKQTLTVDRIDRSGNVIAAYKKFENVDIKAGQITFLNLFIRE